MGYRRVLAVVLGLVPLAACSTFDQRLDPDAPDPVGGAVLQSQDINTMTDEMVRGIIESGILRSNDPAQRVAFHITKLRNDSSDPMDTELILTRIRTRLFQALGRQVKFLDRSSEAAEEVLAARNAKRSNAVTANPDRKGSVVGSDYVLKGTIKDRVVQSRDLKSVAYLVTFELTDLETQELVWIGEYQAKFGTEKSVISR